ncbi:RNA polymerase sigma factor [Paenibacillus montanisoli]|uniref:RNA polymerase subunit sigma-70 n=1 Tax=Paenibacillus montanisoli TaxID=2081970 RepID=A0A328U063_9BACL|nr:RNA polymerase sigma factor [Paenibacillus montanisoli]RAP75422.1 RNA polymerase subunit sigma-70 [Paenibacillus montanisoli]
MNKESSDAQSIALFQSEVYEDKLIALYNEMIQVANAKVYNKSDAQDAVQEAWVRMLMKQSALRERSKLAAWAKAITGNIASNLNKRAARTRPTDDTYILDSTDRGVLRDEAAVMLEISELLEMLDPLSRTMLLYKFYYGFKDAEIAAVMQVPVGTIKARLHRTKKYLREKMS